MKPDHYYAFTQSKYLSQYAGTDKALDPLLTNISILDDTEFRRLTKNYLDCCTATNVPVRITGACYLKLIFDADQKRFRENIMAIIKDSGYSMEDYEDFNDLDYVFIFVDFEDREVFLKEVSASNNPEIRSEAELGMHDEICDYQGIPWYETYCAEYEEFRRKIMQENNLGKVLTIQNWWDGPLLGVAEFHGKHCIYERIFSEEMDDYTDYYHLTPIDERILREILEDWNSWITWMADNHLPKHASEWYNGLNISEFAKASPMYRKYKKTGIFYGVPELSSHITNYYVQWK